MRTTEAMKDPPRAPKPHWLYLPFLAGLLTAWLNAIKVLDRVFKSSEDTKGKG